MPPTSSEENPVRYARPHKADRLVRSNVVNVLKADDGRYLVAPRGNTEWVRNLRAAGRGELRLGHRTEHFEAVELPDTDKAPVLQAYLDRWAFEVGRFFEGLGKHPTVVELNKVAGSFPVFSVRAEHED